MTIETIFPWECYKDCGETKTQYRSLEEMCRVEGFSESVVLDALAYSSGRWGGYTFIRKGSVTKL